MAELLKRRHLVSAFAAYNNKRINEASPTVHIAKEKKRKGSDIATNIETVCLSDNDDDDDRSRNTTPEEESVLSEDSPVCESGKTRKRKAGGQSNGIVHQQLSNHPLSSKKGKSKKRKAKKQLSSGPNCTNGDQFQPNNSMNGSETVSGVWKILNAFTYDDSVYDARLAFAWLIDPISISTFFEKYWEKQPLHIQRGDEYYDGLFSTEELDKILNKHDIQFSVNLDVTKYENGERKTLNPAGRAYANTVWKFYQDGCSVRLLNPQTYSETVWKFNSTMQEFFGTFVGANVYLTPANSQGFAPHYDDIEAFVVQLEGIKRWRIYQPRNEEEVLPRFSSPNFKRNEIAEPILEVELRPGDLLYFPRGYIHEAVASGEEHSLHMTISTTQRNTWGDLLQILVEQAIQTAMIENIDYRRSLPLNYMDLMGTVHMDKKKKGRKAFMEKAKQLLAGLVDYASLDGAADQMAKTYMHDSLPPCLTTTERKRCVQSEDRKSQIVFRGETNIRLLRKHCLRLVMDDEDAVSIYYNSENSRTYHEKELQKIVIEPDLAAGVDFLVESYPKFVRVKELPLDSQAERVRLCQLLYEKSLVIVA